MSYILMCRVIFLLLLLWANTVLAVPIQLSHNLTTSTDLNITELSPSEMHRRLDRGTVVTTSTCDKIRTDEFQAMLLLEFYYTAEFEGTGPHSLEGIESAVLRLVLDALHSCDDDGYPQFALDLQTTHQFSEEGFCIAKDSDNECFVIRGLITIFLDKAANEARDTAYTAIEQGLGDPAFLLMFDPKVVTAKFFRSIQENLVLLRTTTNISSDVDSTTLTSTSVKLAIAAASVAFIVASIFSYGILRRKSIHRSTATRSRNPASSETIEYRRRRFFRQLNDDIESDEESSSEGHIIDVSPTWNVSDITSDSGSIRSILTKSTGKLEKIVEESEGEESVMEIQNEVKVKVATAEKIANERKKNQNLAAIAAYAAHKNRLAEIVRSTCFDAHFEDAFPTRRMTPLTESSSSLNGEESFEEIDWDDQPRGGIMPNPGRDSSDDDVGDDDDFIETPRRSTTSTRNSSYHTSRQELNHSAGEVSEITMEDLASRMTPDEKVQNGTSQNEDNFGGPLSDTTTGSETNIKKWLAGLLLQCQQRQDETVQL